MTIENTGDNIIITIPLPVSKIAIQRVTNYLQYLQATSNSKAKQSDIDELADEVNSAWWDANKERFNKLF